MTWSGVNAKARVQTLIERCSIDPTRVTNALAPSRKYPCKHVLALMWMYVEDPSPFVEGEVPVWVTDWLGRRRNPGAGAVQDKANGESNKSTRKSLTAAQHVHEQSPPDPKAEAKRKAAAEKRAQTTRNSIAQGIDDLQQWLEDQLRTGLSSLLNDSKCAVSNHCCSIG